MKNAKKEGVPRWPGETPSKLRVKFIIGIEKSQGGVMYVSAK